MQIKRPNCEACIHEEICMHKTNANILIDDMRNTINYKGKTYAEIMLPFRIDLSCGHFINKDKIKKAHKEDDPSMKGEEL